MLRNQCGTRYGGMGVSGQGKFRTDHDVVRRIIIRVEPPLHFAERLPLLRTAALNAAVEHARRLAEIIRMPRNGASRRPEAPGTPCHRSEPGVDIGPHGYFRFIASARRRFDVQTEILGRHRRLDDRQRIREVAGRHPDRRMTRIRHELGQPAVLRTVVHPDEPPILSGPTRRIDKYVLRAPVLRIVLRKRRGPCRSIGRKVALVLGLGRIAQPVEKEHTRIQTQIIVSVGDDVHGRILVIDRDLGRQVLGGGVLRPGGSRTAHGDDIDDIAMVAQQRHRLPVAHEVDPVIGFAVIRGGPVQIGLRVPALDDQIRFADRIRPDRSRIAVGHERRLPDMVPERQVVGIGEGNGLPEEIAGLALSPPRLRRPRHTTLAELLDRRGMPQFGEERRTGIGIVKRHARHLERTRGDLSRRGRIIRILRRVGLHAHPEVDARQSPHHVHADRIALGQMGTGRRNSRRGIGSLGNRAADAVRFEQPVDRRMRLGIRPIDGLGLRVRVRIRRKDRDPLFAFGIGANQFGPAHILVLRRIVHGQQGRRHGQSCPSEKYCSTETCIPAEAASAARVFTGTTEGDCTFRRSTIGTFRSLRSIDESSSV